MNYFLTGKPPHAGWWETMILRRVNINQHGCVTSIYPRMSEPSAWRWWNGTGWSHPFFEASDADFIEAYVHQITGLDPSAILWSYHWPDNARVGRVQPCE